MRYLIIILTLFFSIITIAQDGIVKTYYASGKVERRTSFVKEILEGTSFTYYENGFIKSEKNYSNGKLSGVVKNYYSNGLVKDEAQFRNGMLDGVSKSFYENAGIMEVKNYREGELISSRSISYDENYIAPLSAYKEGKNHRKIENDDFICGLEICPEPVGGIEEIESNIIYPQLARQYKLEGYVLITTKINARGIPENIRVLQGLGLGCSEAAIEAVNKTKFVPGKNNGDIVETDVTFKLKFRIKEAEDKIDFSIAQSNQVEPETKKIEQSSYIECEIDECPKPVGGIIELLKNLRYPPNAKRNKISGEVKLKVKVDELGFVISTEVIEGLGYGCDEAAQSTVIKTQFNPGRQNGKETETAIEIIVPFILGKE